MATIQEQIDALQAQINSRLGNVSGVTPAGCNLHDPVTGLFAQIAEFEEQILVLLRQKAAAELNLTNIPFALSFDWRNAPALTGFDQDAGELIEATGSNFIEMSGVTLTVSGNIIITVPDEDNPVLAATKLGVFAKDKGLRLNVRSAEDIQERNANEAQRLLDLAEMQLEMITKVLDGGAELEPIAPEFETPPQLTVTGKNASVVFAAEGTAPITYEMDWGDGTTPAAVTSPATHTYDDYETYYTAILTATNEAGSIQATITVVTGDAPAPTNVAPTITIPPNGATEVGTVNVPVYVTFEATGTPTPTFTMDWGDGSAIVDPATSPISHTYTADDIYTATLTATNGVSPDAVRTIEITIED